MPGWYQDSHFNRSASCWWLRPRSRTDLRPGTWRAAVGELKDRLCLPEIDEKALAGLKFSEALPHHLAVATLASRLADPVKARSVLLESSQFAQ
jgi:ATP-dependent Lhr-like helicase